MNAKLIRSLALAAAGFLASAIVKGGWHLATGHGAPKEDDLEESLGMLILFGVLSAVVAALLQRLAARSTARYIKSPATKA